MPKPRYNRVLLKISGEALMGPSRFGIDKEACDEVARAIKEVYDLGVEIGIVIGGGNIFRGSLAESFQLKRTPADQIGMLATAINGALLQSRLEALGCKSQVMGAFEVNSFIEEFSWKKALDLLASQTIAIFVGGTGHPYFTTDTAAALRASEIGADVLLKATKVDGVYDKDPLKYSDAVRFHRLTYSEALNKKLDVMDAAAIALCRENQIPICVFNLFAKGTLLRVIRGEDEGTLVTEV